MVEAAGHTFDLDQEAPRSGTACSRFASARGRHGASAFRG